MNWYRVLTQHDNFRKDALVLLPGDERQAFLEQIGYLRFFSVDEGVPPAPSEPNPQYLGEEPSTRDEAVKPKRGPRGKQAEAGPVPGEDVLADAGEPPRDDDM